MAIVYMATNRINGKRYIGASINSLTKRKGQHKADAAKPKMKFHWAIRKHGFSMFDWEVLKRYNSAEAAFAAERIWIADKKPEYNDAGGGNPSDNADYITRAVIAYPDGKTFRSAAEAARFYGITNSHVSGLCKNGKSTTKGLSFAYLEERKIHKLGGNPGRKVICVNDKREFPSAAAAALFYGVDITSISGICRRKPKNFSVKGLVFRFADDATDAPDLEMIHRRRLMRPVVCCSDGVVYESIGAAATAYGVSLSAVSAVLRGRSVTTAGGKVFRYADDPTASEIVAVDAGRAHTKAVICVTDGIRYESVSAAAKAYGLNFRHVSAVVLGRQKTTGGLVFAAA